jgi:type IV secretion system protein VirB10
MRFTHFICGVALIAATVLSGCRADDQVAQNGATNASGGSSSNHTANVTVPSGTSIDITLGTSLTSETASVGSGWTGSTRNALVLDGRNVIPAGSSVAGTVTSVKPAHRGDRAMLDLGLTSIVVGNRQYPVRGSTEAVIAGSTRARNLGAIAGATAVGALVGHAIGGSSKGTIIGAVVGGGAATGVVAASDGYQVVLKQGIPLTFTTNETVAVRL